MYIFLPYLKRLAALGLFLPFIVQAAVLDISVDPGYAHPQRLKIGDKVPFLITNNAPKEHTLTNIKVSGGETTDCGIGTNIAAKSGCKMTVTVTSIGKLIVEVEAIVMAEGAEAKIKGINDEYTPAIRFAAFNLSFDRGSLIELLTQLAQTREQQQSLISKYESGETLTEEETALLKAVMQIRNVAEVIQRTDPDVLVLAEFNNDGAAENNQGLIDFQNNYLSHAQHADVSSISYKYTKNIPTNTGLQSGYDLDRSGKAEGPDDAWGFGIYHGQYAFSVFSKIPFDEESYRTFQNFKWKDMEGEKNIEIVNCDGELPDGLQCGDPWYTEDAWNAIPLSSKNHIDLPVILQVNGKEVRIHFMASHPAPPISNNPANHNTGEESGGS